ncbi:hypothetical protein PVLDE_1301270 [Plasmodium vinckei lentum]|uniref:Uncharacterized protein n=1 Tax=Plasmodium vinckei lentum TaxID=138297 RepID=A0A6V7SLT3_PLAVN|nr:hypothetical protein PVLDE_1301270 [Plasmodium vinckei lentum]
MYIYFYYYSIRIFIYTFILFICCFKNFVYNKMHSFIWDAHFLFCISLFFQLWYIHFYYSLLSLVFCKSLYKRNFPIQLIAIIILILKKIFFIWYLYCMYILFSPFLSIQVFYGA